MIEQDFMSKADMVRSPMAPLADPTGQEPDSVKLLLRTYAELLALPVPEPMQSLVANPDCDGSQTSLELRTTPNGSTGTRKKEPINADNSAASPRDKD